MNKDIYDPEFMALWPDAPPPVTVIYGEFGLGKTTLALDTGAKPERTLAIGFEGGMVSYAGQTPFKHWDVTRLMPEAKPKGWKDSDVYDVITGKLEEVKPGEFDVLVLDNASPLEDAFVSAIERTPALAGLTANQVNDSVALKFAGMKKLYFQFLMRQTSKFAMVIITLQMRDKFDGKKPAKDPLTGKTLREAKGKETLAMISSLSLGLELGSGGVPAANVAKCRIVRRVWVADAKHPPKGVTTEMLKQLDGEPCGNINVPRLPLRMPKAKWSQVRAYMRTPADISNPAEGETPSKAALTEDERLAVRARIAEAEALTAEEQQAQREVKERAAQFSTAKAKFLNVLKERKLTVAQAQTQLEPHGLWPFEAIYGQEVKALALLKPVD